MEAAACVHSLARHGTMQGRGVQAKPGTWRNLLPVSPPTLPSAHRASLQTSLSQVSLGCLGEGGPEPTEGACASVSERLPSSVPATGGLGKSSCQLFVPFPPLRRFPLFQLVRRLSRAGDPPGACLHSVRPSSPALPR